MQSPFLSQSDPASRVGAGGVRGVASQERLSEVIMELPFFFFVPFSPLLSISSSVSLTIIYMSILSALLFAAHTHTHIHTQLLHVSLSDISSETGTQRTHGRQPDAPPPKKQQRVESENTQNFRRGTRRGAHWSTACPRQRGDTPDRFWASVEPYCADITEAHLKVLQEGIRCVSVLL